jgi:hypothetical protein
MSQEFTKHYNSVLWVSFDGVNDKTFSIRIDCPHGFHFKYDIRFDKLEEITTIFERFEKDYIRLSLKGEEK